MALSMKDLQAQIQELSEGLKIENENLRDQVLGLKNQVASLQVAMQELQTNKSFKNGRDRGPESLGSMTEGDAVRCMIGDLHDVPHKEAALELGLSYGQVYSARKGYTFKKVYKRMMNNEVDNSFDKPFVKLNEEDGSIIEDAPSVEEFENEDTPSVEE